VNVPAAALAVVGTGLSLLAAHLSTRQSSRQFETSKWVTKWVQDDEAHLERARDANSETGDIEAAAELTDLDAIRGLIAAEGRRSLWLSIVIGALYFLAGSAVTVAVTLFVHPLT
jgi:hypothetical protein